MGLRQWLVCAAVVLTLAGCGQSGPARDATAAEIARAGGLEPSVSHGARFDLQVYRRAGTDAGPLFVYIEGDGAAYLDPRVPSDDPTPADPVALRLAAADPGPAVLYVARPCQFAPGRADRRCTALDWTTRRFAPEVVAAVDAAIDRVRAQTPDRALVLVGYSGGGVVAALVAARRHDVALLITVAAPLDPAEWTRRMGMSPLEGSDSPVAHVGALAGIPQVDFAGARDATVPVGTIRSEIDALGPGAPVRLVVVPDFDHHCCWARDWVRLRAEVWQGTGRRSD